MKKDNSAKSLPVKASKYPTKRTVNLAQRESHSRSTLTLTLGLVLIVVLSFCVANFGVLRQLDRQRAAENAYNTVHSQYTQMQQALADYDNVELQYRTYSRTWMQEEDSPFYIPVDRLEVLDLLEGLRHGENRAGGGRCGHHHHVRHGSGADLRHVPACAAAAHRQERIADHRRYAPAVPYRSAGFLRDHHAPARG